jgi:hypothetical protein
MNNVAINNEQMSNRLGVSKGCSLFIISLLISLLSSCVIPLEPTAVPTAEPTTGSVAPSPLTDAFPGADATPSGWTPDGGVETYDSETIFNLVDGQADFFFVYGFERVAVQRYKNAENVVLDVQVWQLGDDKGAYGLFSAGIAGEPIAICPSTGSGRCNEGDADPGRRLAFWQDRYVAQLFARKAIPDADLQAFGRAISAVLPAGGKRPALVERLPAEGLIPRSAIFFHEEISIQSEVWLGGENILGLSPATDGVLARYEVDGVTVRLLLIEYPDAGAASTAVTALQGGEIESLVTVAARGSLLGAVFGEVDEAAASALLGEALR